MGIIGLITPPTPPEPFGDRHRIEDFISGEPSLDDWLKRRALANQASGASRTYVVCQAARVIGYYALASGAITVETVTGRFRRNMPNPIPVVVLARLAVDQSWQGRGVGRGMFRDAARRVAQAAGTIGVRGIVVHAISQQARNFYLALGFDPCPLDPMTLAVTLADIRATLLDS